MKPGSMLPHLLNLPNWFTAASIFCGMYSIVLSADAVGGDSSSLFRAAIAIVFAGLFDMLDGRVARLTNTASEFGVQFDSLADVISFGVAPAFLLYKWGLEPLGVMGLLVAFVYLAAGAMRLARFNIITHKMSNEWSLGLTITESGGLVASLVICHHQLGGEPISPLVALPLVLGLAYLMGSTLRFRTFKRVRMTRQTLTVLGVLGGFSVLAVLFYQEPTILLVLLPTAHIVSGLVEELIFYKQRRLEDQQLLLVEDVRGAAPLGSFSDPDEALEEEVR